MRATLLWMLWVPGSWNWSSLGSSMVAPGDLSHDMPNNDKCHVHATMHLMSYSIHSDRPLGWCIPCLQCGKRPATATAKPVNGYMRPRATWKSLSWPLSSNSPSLRHKSSVKNHVSNSHDGPQINDLNQQMNGSGQRHLEISEISLVVTGSGPWWVQLASPVRAVYEMQILHILRSFKVFNAVSFGKLAHCNTAQTALLFASWPSWPPESGAKLFESAKIQDLDTRTRKDHRHNSHINCYIYL